MSNQNCVLCSGRSADQELGRVEVWSDNFWRLTMALSSEVLGFAYLEPRRHIKSIADLEGREAQTFGVVMSRCCAALKEATGAEIVYVYIFGDGVPHLHVHLAPHMEGDGLNDQIIKGELIEETLSNGMTTFSSATYPPLPRVRLEAVADNVTKLLALDLAERREEINN